MYLTNLQKKNIQKESNLENETAREWVPLYLPNYQGFSCSERHEHDGGNGVVHHLTGKLFPQVHDAKHCCSPS
jgi:hypothetical protein